MPREVSRAVLAALLETAPATPPSSRASASMKRLTVDPEPTPITAPRGTYASAASATWRLSSSCVIACLQDRRASR